MATGATVLAAGFRCTSEGSAEGSSEDASSSSETTKQSLSSLSLSETMQGPKAFTADAGTDLRPYDAAKACK